MSVLGVILDQLVIDVETTSVERCHRGFVHAESVFPYAEIILEEFELDLDVDINNYLEADGRLQVRVTSEKWEATQLAIEEILVLWYSDTRESVIRNLQITNIRALDIVLPIQIEEQTTKRYKARIEFELKVRYLYNI